MSFSSFSSQLKQQKQQQKSKSVRTFFSQSKEFSISSPNLRELSSKTESGTGMVPCKPVVHHPAKPSLLYRLFHTNVSCSSDNEHPDLLSDSDSDHSSIPRQLRQLSLDRSSKKHPLASAALASDSDFSLVKPKQDLPRVDPLPLTESMPDDPINSRMSLLYSRNSSSSQQSLSQKYGWIERGCIGKGANGVVRICHLKKSAKSEVLYAIKEFRKKHKHETERALSKKINAEFCISSSMHHCNVIETVDLIKNEENAWCEVMEYCAGGDLHTAIRNKSMSAEQCNFLFVQLLLGVVSYGL